MNLDACLKAVQVYAIISAQTTLFVNRMPKFNSVFRIVYLWFNQLKLLRRLKRIGLLHDYALPRVNLKANAMTYTVMPTVPCNHILINYSIKKDAVCNS